MSEPVRYRDLGLRLLAAAAVGTAVAGTAYLCAFRNMRGAPGYEYGAHHLTQRDLDALDAAVREHRQVTGRLPADLAELRGVGDEVRRDEGGRFVDGWRNPYQYRAEGEAFTLSSLGADGSPGGVGRHADLYPTSAGRPRELPTLRQFTFELPTEGVQWTCFLAGACAALVCLLPPRNHSRVGLLARVGATAVGAALAAVVISAVHVPSGH